MSVVKHQSEYGSLMHRILDLKIKINNLDSNDPNYLTKKKEFENKISILEYEKNYKFGESHNSVCYPSTLFSSIQDVTIFSHAGRTDDSHPQLLSGVITSNPFASSQFFRVGYQ